MNARQLALTAIALLGTTSANAQPPKAPRDPVQDAVHQFNQNRAKTNEVTVVLAPENSGGQDARSPVTRSSSPEPSVTKPSANLTVLDEPPAPVGVSDSSAPNPADQPARPPRQGLAVHVEKLQIGTGVIDPSQVKLLAPFPAKPLGPAPAGWSFQASPAAPPITREVELSPGNKITLSVHPHLLVPDTDGVATFCVPEPGFDATLGYRQTATVGAILAHSIRQLDDDAKNLGTTIDQLQQLLVSLPKPPTVTEPPPAAQPAPAPALKPTRKR